MYWIIDDRSFNEVGYDVLIDTVKRMNIPHILVKVIPFGHTLEPEPVINDMKFLNSLDFIHNL